MAKFGSPIHVSLPKKDTLLLGVEASRDSDNVLITSDNKYIILYNFQDQRSTKDWAFHGQMVTCAAVCYGNPQQFSAVINKSIIRTWTKDDINVDKCKKTSTLGYVHRLWAPRDRETGFVVYEDGSCASMDDARSLQVESQWSPEDKIIWSGHAGNGRETLVILCRPENAEDIVCLVYRWDSVANSLACHKETTAAQDIGKSVLDCSVCQMGSTLYIYILGEDSKLVRLCDKGNNALATTTCVMKGVSNCKLICAIDDMQLVAVCLDKKTGKNGVTIWDSKFGSMQSFVHVGELRQDSKLFRAHNHIFVPTTEGLLCIPQTTSKPTLLAVIARNQSENTAQKSSGLNKEEENAQNLLNKLVDEEQMKNEEQFVKTFGEFAKCLPKARNTFGVLWSSEINKLVNRTVTSGYWPGAEAFKTLIKTRVLQGNLITEVVALFIQHDELELIHEVLSQCFDISESVISTCLQYYMRKFGELEESEEGKTIDCDQEDGSEDESTDLQSPFCSQATNYINTLLVLPYNDIFMIDYIRKMTFHEIMAFLKYLVYLLNETSASKSESQKRGIPTLSQVIGWLNLVLDAHFMQIILSEESRETLMKLNNIVDTQVKFYDDLVSLESLLYQLKDKAFLPRKQQVGEYCIQMLHVA